MIEEAVVAEGAKTVAAPAAKTLAMAKAIMVSPVFGIVALGGIIAFELWKGGRDARAFEVAKDGGD